MNMMRFNEGGMTSEMLQQAMEAQAANMGQDITGDSFILTGQYSSPVQQEEDGREYVEYQHPDMQEPVKVYGNWNEYAVSQDENGMMLIGDEDYPIMQDEEGNYMLNEQKFDDQMTAITERQGAEAMAREAAQGSTQGASKMENLMEMLQDAQGPQGQGGQYEEGGEIPEYFLGGLMGKSNKMIGRMRDKVRGAGRDLAGASGLGMMKQLMGRMRDRRGGGAQEAQASQVSSGAMDRTFEPKPVKEFFAGGMLGLQNMRDQHTDFRAQQEAKRQQRMAAYQAAGGGNQISQPGLQSALEATDGQITRPDGSVMNVAVPGAPAGSAATIAAMNQQAVAAAAPAPAPTGQVPVQDPNAAVANQAAAMAQPQAGVATMGGGRGVMQNGGKIKQQTMKYGGKVIKAYDEGGKNGGSDGLGDGPFSESIRMLDERAKPALNVFGQEFEKALEDGEGWAEAMRDEIKSKGYGLSDIREGNVPAHVLLGNKGDKYGDVGGDVFRRLLKSQAGLDSNEANRLTNSLENFGFEISKGYINVDNVDKSMTSRGYTSDDSKMMSSAISGGALHPAAFSDNESFDQGTGVSEVDRSDNQYLLPSAVQFREKYSKSFDKKGNWKGEGRMNFRPERFNFDDEVSTRPNAESFTGDPETKKTDPIDPIDPRRTEIPQQKITGQIIPPQEIIVKKEEEDEVIVKEEEEEEDNGGGGLPRFDLGFDTVNPSDYTGGEAQVATGPFANQTEMDRRVNAVTREFGAGGRVIKYSDGGSFPDLNKDGKITMADILKGRGVKGEYAYGGKMRSYENGGDTGETDKPERISHEDLYKKYLKSRDKKMYTDQPAVAKIVKEQERLFMQRGRKFADGTGYNDLFEYGGKMKNYASGGKVLRFR